MKRRPTHPGEMLREDFLPDYGLTASGFAKSIGVSRRTVNELLHEHRGVSVRMALFLSRYFGNSPEFWLNAQRNVDLWDALQTNKKIINRIVPLDTPSPYLEGDPRFLKKVDTARKSLRSGKGIRLEDCRMRPEYDFKSGVRGKYAKRHCRDGFVAGERDAKIIERNLKSLNKQARDVMSYQVPMSRLEKGYLAMAMDEERRTMLPERKEGLEKKDKDKQKRLARECAKCDPREEKAMAEEVMRTSPPAAKPRQEWARRFRDAIRKERAAEYPENRAAKGSRSGFEQALKKVRDARPARKDAL